MVSVFAIVLPFCGTLETPSAIRTRWNPKSYFGELREGEVRRTPNTRSSQNTPSRHFGE